MNDAIEVAGATGEVLRLRDDAVVWREIGHGIVALDFDGSEYLKLNETASILWKHMVGGATRDQLVHSILDAFDISAERATSDVESFIANCRARNLLRS